MKKVACGLMMIPAIPKHLMAQWQGSCAYGAPDLGLYHGYVGDIAMLLAFILILGALMFFGMRFIKTGYTADTDPLKILKSGTPGRKSAGKNNTR